MTSQSTARARTLALALLIASLGLACSRSPREHWWQLWRPKPSIDIVHVDDDLIPPADLEPYDLTDSWGELDPDYLAVTPGEEMMGLPEPEPIREDPEGIIVDLATIYFAFDSYTLTNESRVALEDNANWIADRPGLTIRLEGHCDERGTEEYNFNLGQKRAQSVREYLVRQGLGEERLHTWSWGELRPMDPGASDTAWAQNRRVQFAVWSVD
jgi:peptidoglycan-associated lipoprotein